VGINTLLKELVEACTERREKREEIRTSPDFDEQELEVIEEENEEEDRFISDVYYAIAAMVKSSKDSYVPSFHKLLFPLFWKMLGPEKSVGEHIAALCIMDDIIAYGGKPGLQYLTGFVPVVIKYCTDKDADVRQAAVWGVGACAQVAGAKFLPLAEGALDILSKVVMAPDSRSEENEACTDNAIGAVGKICKYVLTLKGQEKQLAKVLPIWLNWLPLKGDFEEGHSAHDILCDLLENYGPVFQLDKNLPKVLSIFGTILGTNFVTEVTAKRIEQIFKNMCKSIPKPAMAAAIARIPPEEQTKLQEIVEGKSSEAVVID